MSRCIRVCNPPSLRLEKKANRNRFYRRLQDRNQVIRQWKSWRGRGRGRGCRCDQQGVRYDHKFRRMSGTWRWSVNWRGSRWTCPPRRGNVVHEVRASEKSFGQFRGWVLYDSGEAGAFFWVQRSPYLIGRSTFCKLLASEVVTYAIKLTEVDARQSSF